MTLRKMKNEAVVYIHGKGGNAGEAERYKSLFPDCDVIGFDYSSDTPWDAKREFPEFFDAVSERYGAVSMVANSIGAYFAMHALSDKKIKKAFFISPVADMEKLVSDMMASAGVTEDELMEKGEIATDFGETLSWKYLSYVRENPIKWSVPTHIIYGENDALVSRETVSEFAAKIGATLDVMPGGEHWFHTEEQLGFIDDSIVRRLK